MSQHDIEQAEMTLEDAKQIVKTGRLTEQLASHSGFRKIILEGYFKEEAARLATCFSDPLLNEKARLDIQNAIHGIGALRRYLQRLVSEGQIAASSITDYENEIAAMRREADEDDQA